MVATGIKYHTNKATEADLRLHLTSCAPYFTPPLNERVDITAYAKKLAEKAVSFEAWQEDRLVGAIAVYVNKAESTAFITSVSVEKELMGSGVAAQLLQRCIVHAGEAGVQEIGLEVNKDNAKAIHFYEKFSFQTTRREGDSLFMNLVINNHP